MVGTYTQSGSTIQTNNVNFSALANGGTVVVSYQAYDRPNRFNIYGNGSLIATSGWVGSDNTYAGPWGDAGSLGNTNSGDFSFVYDNTKTYELRVEVGGANPSNILDDTWNVTFTCVAPTVTPTPTLTPTPTITLTPTISLTPTITPTHTPTPTNCTGCTSYTIVIDQLDINLSDDKKVWIYYNPCGDTGTTLSSVSFSNPGTYTNYICTQNCPDTAPYVCINYDGGCTSVPNTSRITPSGSCTPEITYLSCTTQGTVFTYTVSTPGYNYVPTHIELNQTCGNVPITISATTVNSTNEIFVGNIVESYGNIYEFGAGTFNNPTGDTVGYYSSSNKTTLDFVVYSVHTGATFTPYTITFNVSCPDFTTCTISTEGTTLVSGTTLNVTKTGYIRYNTDVNTSVDLNITTLGTYTINTCIISGSIRSAFPLLPSLLANYTNVVYGNNCASPTNSGLVTVTFTLNQGYGDTIYWIDGNGVNRSRFLYIGETFTTCAYYGSASGFNTTIAYGTTCNPSSEPVQNSGWYRYSISTSSNASCDTICGGPVTTDNFVYSRARSFNEFLNFPMYNDMNGTLFEGTGNFYRVTSEEDVSTYGWSVQIGPTGTVYDVQQCLNNNPGLCHGSI